MADEKTDGLSENSKLGHYKILNKIGAGGMGEVFLAQDTKLDRRVALKILPAEFAADKDRMNRFVREARSASALNHPNIITIYEVGESEGTHFIAAEFIDGKTLNDYAKANALNYKLALEIAIQVASALDEAHAAGIVHRDIKPDNVMIRANGLAKILDFGIAKLSTPKTTGEEDATAIKGGTSPGMIIGTANYMSPEQAKGKAVDVRTDVFSFGVVFYEMIAGHLPFEGENALEMIGSILKDEPQPLDSDVPPEIAKIIDKCLRKDRDERYQTIKDVLIDLKDVKQDLEFHDKLERSIIPNEDANKTQILKATTADEINQTTTNQTLAGNPRTKYSAIGLLALILIVGGFFGYKYLAPTKQIESIAVMPFVNTSGNQDIDYLSDGMTETLIGSLSNLPGLSVKSSSTVFFYKGKEMSPKKIGEELNVQAVLLGRFLQRGDDLKLNLELVNTNTQDVIWSQQYDRKQSNLVTLQNEIARDVSQNLKNKITGEEVAQLNKTGTANPEAYQLYLKGKYYTNKFTKEGVQQGNECFRQAIALDPNYSSAYSGLAYNYINVDDWSDTARNSMPQAKEAALKALAIDANDVDAHVMLAIIAHWYEWDWATSEREFKRSLELNPKNAESYEFYSWLLSPLGRHDEAIAIAKQGLQVEPLDSGMNFGLASALIFSHRWDEAIAHLQNAIKLDPNYWFHHSYLGRSYTQKGRLPEAIAEFKLALANDPHQSENWACLAYAYALSGQKAEAQKIADDLKNRKPDDIYASPYNIAVIYAGLGNTEQAFSWLEKAYSERSFYMVVYFPNDERLEKLHSDPRYKDLLKRMNLPE